MTPPTPTWLPVTTPTAWWRVRLRRGEALSALGPHEDTDATAVLVDWLLESADRHRIEIRLGTSGQHAGAWIGLSSVGATRSDADAAWHSASTELDDALRSFGWRARRQTDAPALPRTLAALHTPDRVPFVSHFRRTRHTMCRVAPKRAPLVLRVCVDPSPRHADHVRQACTLRQQARVRALRALRAHARDPSGGARIAHAETLRKIERLRDAVTAVRVRLTLCGRVHPGRLPLRLLDVATSEDLASIATWGPTPASMLEGGYELLLELLDLAALHKSPILSRRGCLSFDEDELPPLL